ncbi:hypothetical protein A2U01_0035581, partial [Trifolium medium]|nr:hypothetical protein [Trifolium medium]
MIDKSDPIESVFICYRFLAKEEEIETCSTIADDDKLEAR